MKLIFLHSLWSDVAFFVYRQRFISVSHGTPNLTNLRLIIHLDINDADNLTTIWANVPGLYPGGGLIPAPILLPRSEALLGSPTSSGVAWMLLQHNVFGNKMVLSNDVWQSLDQTVHIAQLLGPKAQPATPWPDGVV